MCQGPLSETVSVFMRNEKVKVFLPMVLAGLGLGLYPLYLRDIDYPIHWALVGVLAHDGILEHCLCKGFVLDPVIAHMEPETIREARFKCPRTFLPTSVIAPQSPCD